MQIERPHNICVGVHATVIDAGAALGRLLAYFLGTLVPFVALDVVAGGVLALATLEYWWAGSNKAQLISTGNE